jgi:hypothetical protein
MSAFILLQGETENYTAQMLRDSACLSLGYKKAANKARGSEEGSEFGGGIWETAAEGRR